MKVIIMLLKSLLFGSEGSYNILGVDVNFKKSDPLPFAPPSPSYYFTLPTTHSTIFNALTKSIGHLANYCLNSNVIRLTTQGYAHTFVHEMGHALACKALTDATPSVLVYTDLCEGRTFYISSSELSPTTNSLISVAGPMADALFANFKLAAAARLINYAPVALTPVALTIGLGAAMWMTGELFLAYISASSGEGDFGDIAKHGPKHLALASTALVGQCVLGLFAAYKLI